MHLSVLKKEDGKYEVLHRPSKVGRYIVMIKFGGQEIPKSPFEVNVGPVKTSKIRAYGPGLTGGVVGFPALFTVETNDETGALGKQLSYSSICTRMKFIFESFLTKALVK